MESHSSTPSILPPSPPPLRPQLTHNLKENGNDKNNGVGYLLSTKNLPPQRKTSHLHFTKGTNTYKNNLQSSKKLFSMTPLVEEAGTLSKRVRCSENDEEEEQYTKNKEEENGTEVTSKTYNQNTYEGNTEQSNFTVEHDVELDNDDSIIALSNRRQESTDCDSIDYSLRSEESPVTALLSPTASTTTLPYNSSLDTPRVEDTYKSDFNEEVREHSFRSNDNEVCEHSKQNEKYEIQEINTLRKEEEYEGQEGTHTNDEFRQCVKSPGDNNTKRKLPLSSFHSSSSLSSSSAPLSEHEEELEEEEKYGQQIQEEHEQEDHLEKSQSTLSTITVSSSSTSQEDNEHQNVAFEEEQDEMKKLSEINGDKESSDEEDEMNDSSSSSSSLYRRNDDLFILEEEEQEEEQEEQEEEEQEQEKDRAETNVQEEEKVVTRKLSSSDADTRNFILPPPMPLSPCETNHLLSLNVSDEVKDNNDSDTCSQTNEEHEQKYVAKGNEEEEQEEIELPDSDKREESDKEKYTSNIIANELDNKEHDSTMPDVKSVNNKCEINNNDHSIVVATTTSDTSRIDNSNDVIDNEVNVIADGEIDVNNGSHKDVQVKKLVTRELESPLADEEQESDREHTPHDKVIKWPEDNNTHDEPKTRSVQESTTFVHKSHPSTLTSELSSIILLSSSSTPPPLALLPRTEQVKTQTHLSLLQETHNKDSKQATKRAQRTILPDKDHNYHQQQIQQEQQMSREQREEINKLIRKAFVELGGKLAKTNVNSREKVNESTNNKYDNKNYTSSMKKNKTNKGDSGSKDANRHINKITNSRAENVHGVQLGRLCRALSEFGISFDVEKFRKENNELFTNKENKSNQHDKERTEHSFHSLQLFPFRSQSNEYEEEEDHGILTYNTFAHIIKTALLQGKDHKGGDDGTTKVPTHTLNQNKSQLQLNKHNDLTSENKTSYEYMTLASERSSDLLMSSILSLHETINNANYGNNNKNTLEKVINSEQTREKQNDALVELEHQESTTRSNRSSPDVHMEHIDATRAKSYNRDKAMRNTASIKCKQETSTVAATPQRTCTDHAEESLNELHSAHIAENNSMIDSDLDSCHYTPHISRFTSASSITSSARAPSISSSYYEDSAVNVEFPEVTPTSAIAELCRRIRHRLYSNKRMALQDRERERRSAKKSEPIQLDEHPDHANNMNSIKSVQVSNKHTHHMNLAEDKMKVEKAELHKKPTLAINVRKSEKNIKVVINDKSDNTKTNSSITAFTTTISTTTTSISNKTDNGATVTIDANQKSHTIKPHSKQTKHNKNKNLHSPSQSSTTSTSVLPADNAKVPRSSGGASHSVPEQRTSISASSISSSPLPKRPSLVATLRRPVIISSKVEEELVRLSPYYTKRFVQFRHASHLRSSDSNISYSSNHHSSIHQIKSSEKVEVGTTSSANTNSLEPATTVQSENALLLEEKSINEPENFHRHSEPAQERITTPALSSASALSSAASLPLPSRHFTSPFRSRTPEWSSHLGTEPVRWSSNVSELFEQ